MNDVMKKSQFAVKKYKCGIRKEKTQSQLLKKSVFLLIRKKAIKNKNKLKKT